MTYNVFGGTLSLTQSISHLARVPVGMDKGTLVPTWDGNAVKCLCISNEVLLSKVSMYKVFMHYFLNMSSALGLA